MHPDIKKYNETQLSSDRALCEQLAGLIDTNLPKSESKVWHGHPVWFLDGNPVAGYSKMKDSVRLLFWSGQSFGEEGLHDEGKFKAAEKRYQSTDEINAKEVKRWLRKAREIQWDYKNIVKRKGKLERLS